MKSIIGIVLCALATLSFAQLDLGLGGSIGVGGSVGGTVGGTVGGVVGGVVGGLLFGDSCTLISGGLWSSPTCWAGGVLPSLTGSATVTADASVALTCNNDQYIDTLIYGQAQTTVSDNVQFAVNTCEFKSGSFQLGSNSEYNIGSNANVYAASSNAAAIYSNGNGRITFNSGASCNVAGNAHLYTSGVQYNGGTYQLADYGHLHAESCQVVAPTYVRGTTNSKCHLSGSTNVDSNLYVHSHTDVAAGSTVNVRGYGNVEVANNANLNLQACTVNQPGYNAIVKVGNDFGSAGTVIVKAHPSPCHFSGGYYDIRANGEKRIEAGASAVVDTAVEYSGTGHTHHYGSYECAAPVKIGHYHTCHENAEFKVSGAGYAHVGAAGNGGELEFNSAKCTVANAGSQSHVIVGAASGAAAYLRFRGSEAAPCEIRGGNYEVRPTGVCNVEQYSKTQITAPTYIKSANRVNVIGHLAAEAPTTCEGPIHVHETGKLNFNTAYDHSVKTLTYASSTSETVIRASSSGFKPIKVTGSAAYNGKLTVDAGSYAPTSRVTLVDCAQATGQYSSVNVVTSTAAKGRVVYDGPKVCYEPL